MNLKPARAERLARFLNGLAEDYRQQPPACDPGILARRYKHPRDRELVAFIASMFTFGSQNQILEFLEVLLNRMGRQPGRMLIKANRTVLNGLVEGLSYLFISEEGIYLFLHALRSILRRHRSLEELFVYSRGPEAQRRYLDVLDRFSHTILHTVSDEEKKRTRVSHLVPRPAKGSAVMRLHLFMRLVQRPDDDLDLGLWSQLPARSLLLPVDSEILKYLRWLKLSHSDRANRSAVLESTRTMQLLDPEDPARFSQAFSRMSQRSWGIEDMRDAFRKA